METLNNQQTEKTLGFALVVLHKPDNPTEFKRGDLVKYDDCTELMSSPMLVVGEDNSYLHTFFIEGEHSGNYYGIAKKPDNLKFLVKVEFSTEDMPLPEDEEILDTIPLITGRFDLDQEAMRLVSAKHSKFALVALVRWLLTKVEALKAENAAAPTPPEKSERPHWKTDGGWKCLNCGTVLTQHENQIFCPTPPEQEDEPVLYQMWHSNFPTWVNCSKLVADKFAARNEGHVIRGLYTRPDNSGLRKAAEELLKICDGKGRHEMFYKTLENLRAALEGK